MRETALASFRAVIQKHPYADAAEMAKMELDTLDKKL
jgi:TolA-binding protein